MSTTELIIVVAITVIIFVLLKVAALYARNLNRMSKYAMTILLDDILYQKERAHFLELVETVKTTDPNAIFHTAMLNLEDRAASNAVKKTITLRMWQMNQRFSRTGQKASELGKGNAGVIGDEVGKTEIPYPNLDQNLKTGQKIAKVLMAIYRLRKRFRGF